MLQNEKVPFIKVYQIKADKFKEICSSYPEFRDFIIMRST